MTTILPLYRYILLAGLRDRVLWTVLGLLSVVGALSLFFGGAALTEQDEFARVSMAFGFRLAGVVLLSVFVVNFIRRSFEARDVEYLLSRPVGRISFVLIQSLGFSTVGVGIAFLLGGAVVASAYNILHEGVFLWWVSLAVEFVIMANVALFFALVMTSSTACIMIVLAFYLLARLMGEILGIVDAPGHGVAIDLMSKVMDFVSVFIPRLDLMGQTKWILYGLPDDISFPFVVIQGLVFSALVVGAGVVDLYRRQF